MTDTSAQRQLGGTAASTDVTACLGVCKNVPRMSSAVWRPRSNACLGGEEALFSFSTSSAPYRTRPGIGMPDEGRCSLR
jgi:hypothetical protein